MTPIEINQASDIKLVLAYKQKARCAHSYFAAGQIFNELSKRLGKNKLLDSIKLAEWHMQNEGMKADYQEFDEACVNLVKLL